VFLPVINSEFEIHDDVIISAVQRFIFVVVLMLPFEIRDLKYDSLKLATVPQRIGVKQTKILGLLLTLLLVLLEYLKDDIHLNYLASLLAISVIMLLFLKFSTQQQGKYYCGFWVESLPIFWLVLLLMFG
jgi:hypothetical protein